MRRNYNLKEKVKTKRERERERERVDDDTNVQMRTFGKTQLREIYDRIILIIMLLQPLVIINYYLNNY